MSQSRHTSGDSNEPQAEVEIRNVQKIDLDVVAFSKRAHIRYVSGKLARVARARRAVLVVVAFWFEFALACRAFVLRTIECSGRLVRT